MRLLFTLTLSSFVSGNVIFGTLFVSKIEDEKASADLAIKNDRLVLSDRPTAFDYADGIFQKFQTEKYLSVNDVGELVMTSQPSVGFLAGKESGSRGERLVSYKGAVTFQLCSNNSVRYNSTSTGCSKVMLSFQEFH